MPGSKKSKTVAPGLTIQGDKQFSEISRRVYKYGFSKSMPMDDINAIASTVYKNIKESSDQEQTGRQFLWNMKTNKRTAKNLYDLVFNKKSDVPSESVKSSKSKASSTKEPIEPVAMEEQEPLPADVKLTFTDEPPSSAFNMQIDQEEAKEPKLSPAQIQHIKDVVKILEKDPKLKSDIKRTITEELTKGYINPEQFKQYSQELENVAIANEAPVAVRETKKTPKPRAKKSAQSDKAILPMEIETNIQKGKPKKSTRQKKEKVVVL